MRLAPWALGLTVTAVLGAQAPALADQITDYHPDQQARDFAAGPGGWTGTSNSAGICVQDFTCPTVTNSWAAGDGASGGADGHLQTTIENLAGAESTSRGIWTSPSFTYRGAEGEIPTELTFELARRTALSPLLSTSGSSAHYSVELVETASGLARTIIDTAPLGAAQGWAQTPVMTLKPGSLNIGATYVLRITTTFDTEAQAFAASTVDFDDVVLEATHTDAGGGGGGGGGGGPGGGGGGAVLDGNRLFLRLKCLGVATHHRCKVRAVAYSSKGGARMTFPIERKVKSKKGKRVTLRVRPRFIKQLSHSKNVLVRAQLHAGDRDAVKFKRYKLTKP
jgi:hypothetical protein